MISRRTILLLLAPALLFIAVFLIVPISGAVWTSLFRDTPFEPRAFRGLANYAAFLRDDLAIGTLPFTIAFVLVTVAVEILLGLALALILNETFRGRGFVRAAVLVPWAIPTVVAAVLWKYLFNDQYGGVNALLFGGHLASYRAWLAEAWSARAALVVADVWKTSAFAGLILLAGLQSIPRDLYEAARADGAGAWRRFTAITLPLLRPALVLAVLFRVMDAFRVFDLVYVMTQGGPGDATNVLQYYGYRVMFPEQRLGYGSAVSVIVFLLIAIVSVFAVRLQARGVAE